MSWRQLACPERTSATDANRRRASEPLWVVALARIFALRRAHRRRREGQRGTHKLGQRLARGECPGSNDGDDHEHGGKAHADVRHPGHAPLRPLSLNVRYVNALSASHRFRASLQARKNTNRAGATRARYWGYEGTRGGFRLGTERPFI